MRVRRRLPWGIIVGGLVVLVLAGAGIGGYLVGSSSDIDLDGVGLEAAAKGRAEGAERGMKEGYPLGYRSARKRTYASAFSTAYTSAYAAEFESVGLDPPETIRVPDPR